MKAILLAFVLLAAAAAAAQEGRRALTKEVVIEATVDEAWRAWATPEGIRTFFAPGCNVELRVGGPYEILFFPDAPPGQRGAEGLKVLGFEPGRMLSFEWNSPPQWPEVRKQKMRVVITLEDAGEGRTRVTLVQDGWGEGEDWDQVFDYFIEAWDVVLERLQRRFRVGPVDWSEIYPPQSG